MKNKILVIPGIAVCALASSLALWSRVSGFGTNANELESHDYGVGSPDEGCASARSGGRRRWALWFTEQMTNKIGRLDPKSGAFKEYPLKLEDSGPHGLVSDREGNIWFTGNFKGYIGKLDPKTGAVTEYKIPDRSGDDPHTAVFDGQGMLWFTLQVANVVGRLDPRTGKIDLKKAPTAESHPYGIAINSKGIPIFCEFAHEQDGEDRSTNDGDHGIQAAAGHPAAANGD